MNAINPQIATFSHYAASGINRPLHEFTEGIKTGKWAKPLAKMRSFPKGSADFEKLKKRLPCGMLSCATNGGKKLGDVAVHSGFLQIDIDGVGAEHAAHLRDRIGDDRHILAAWISPSRTGVKGIMRIPADVARHKAAFEAAADYMRETYGVEIDPACSNVNRLCYVSHDAEIVLNTEAVPLEVNQVFAESVTGREEENSSESEYCITSSLHNKPPVLHNKVFSDFDGLAALFQNLVSRRYGKPQRGTRNGLMVEITASCFCALAPEFVLAFAVEYFKQHADVFADYPLETYQREVESMLAGCLRDYPQRLSEGERHAYAALGCQREQAAFRIAQSLSKCESDATVPPPLFFLSCPNLADRLGIFCMSAGRILKHFEAMGIIKLEVPGVKRAKGQKGIAAVYRWMLPLPKLITPEIEPGNAGRGKVIHRKS